MIGQGLIKLISFGLFVSLLSCSVNHNNSFVSKYIDESKELNPSDVRSTMIDGFLFGMKRSEESYSIMVEEVYLDSSKVRVTNLVDLDRPNDFFEIKAVYDSLRKEGALISHVFFELFPEQVSVSVTDSFAGYINTQRYRLENGVYVFDKYLRGDTTDQNYRKMH